MHGFRTDARECENRCVSYSTSILVRNCPMHFLLHENKIKEHKFESRPHQREGGFEDCSGLRFLTRKSLADFF